MDTALATFRDLDDRCGQAEVLNHSGATHLAMRKPSPGHEQFELALHLSQEINLPLQEAHAWYGLAQCELTLGSPTVAIEDLSHALPIYERLGSEERLTVTSQLRMLTNDDPGSVTTD